MDFYPHVMINYLCYSKRHKYLSRVTVSLLIMEKTFGIFI